MRIRSMRFILGFLGFFGIGSTLACSCGEEGNIEERVKSSDLVFEGELLSVSIDTVLMKRFMNFKVKRVLNETSLLKRSQITIESELFSSACGFAWPPGTPSVIFTRLKRKSKRTIFESTMCSGNLLNPKKVQLDSIWKPKLKSTNRNKKSE